MAIKEFVAKQAIKQILPLIGEMSDKNLGKFLALTRTLAPTEFTKSFIDGLIQLRKEQHPIIELLRRVINQSNPHFRQRLINTMLIKYHWYGSVRRNELRSQGLHVPGVILISPTMRCNLRCTGCYAASYSTKDDLELEVIDRVLSEMEELGIFWATILGGEPFLRQDMWEIYKKHDDVFFQIYTNGTLVDKEVARKLAALGNMLIIFSLEGFEEETDARRGKGIFRKVTEGMDNLREVGVPFGFSTMVTRQNVDTLVSDDFYDMLVEKGCLIGWQFLYIPSGPTPDTNLMPTAEQRELLRVRGPRRIRSEKPIFTIDFWNDAPHMGGCIAGAQHFLHINSHGDVEPCIFIHMATHNIHDKSLREVIDSPFFRAFRDRQPYSENLLRPCTMIDHPQVLREICAECHPYSTDGPMCGLITSPVTEALDKYSQEAAKILDLVWEREFADFRFTGSIIPEKFAPREAYENGLAVKPSG
jgi:MoaA/NifB/PqqE/SkfB family radical SAM enzyme